MGYIYYAFLIAITVRLLPKFSTTKQVCDFDGLFQNPTPCSCCDSEFLYAPCGHIVTGDFSIVRSQNLKDVLRKGPKYREPVSFSWHQNFNIIMDACEEYARRWTKKEDVEVDTLSEWVKSIADVLKHRIQRLKGSVNTRHESIFCDPEVVRELSSLHENVCHSSCRLSFLQLHICLQEVLRQHLDRGTWT